MKPSSSVPFPSALRPPAFFGTLKSEIKEAAQTKHPVLVLIFGHGEKETSEIFLVVMNAACISIRAR